MHKSNVDSINCRYTSSQLEKYTSGIFQVILQITWKIPDVYFSNFTPNSPFRAWPPVIVNIIPQWWPAVAAAALHSAVLPAGGCCWENSSISIISALSYSVAVSFCKQSWLYIFRPASIFSRTPLSSTLRGVRLQSVLNK